MAAQSKRTGEAKVIAARAEVEAAKLMRQAADILSSAPAMQIRYLEAMQAMAKSANSKVSTSTLYSSRLALTPTRSSFSLYVCPLYELCTRRILMSVFRLRTRLSRARSLKPTPLAKDPAPTAPAQWVCRVRQHRNTAATATASRALSTRMSLRTCKELTERLSSHSSLYSRCFWFLVW